jgi:hypothetical protein
MATPARTSILLNVETTLGLIAPATYKTTVDTVEHVIKARDRVKEGQLPYVGFGAGRETIVHQSFDSLVVTMPLTVVGYITASTWALRSAAINDLIDDIIAVMGVDPRRGASAIDTRLLGDETDEVDPDAGVRGMCIVDFEIEYERLVSST